MCMCTGRTLKGIHFAVSFLETWQKKQSNKPVDYLSLLAKDKYIVVIGGGDTGCDCIGTALRQVSDQYTLNLIYISYIHIRHTY